VLVLTGWESYLVMRNIFKGGVAATMIIGLAACASTTEPVQEATKPVERVAETVAEAAPVQRAAPVRQGPVGPLAGSVADFRQNVGERVYFDLNGWGIDSSDQEILKRQAAWLQSYPDVRVLVAGNCDERGTRDYNLALGERRAATVKEYLVDLGVDPSRVETLLLS